MKMNYQQTKQTIRWAIIGCGNVTEVKSGPAYQKIKGFELKSVMRRNLDKARDYAKRHKVPDYSNNADELIFNDELDAIYIATPPDSHMHYALKVAEAGKPCCIEKPMAPTYQECATIQNAFKEKGLPLFVAYYRRSLPRFIKVKEWLEQNAIGDVRHVHWHFCKPANDLDLAGSYNWRTDPKIASGGYFDDLASHGLDLIAYLLGDIKDVKGVSTNQQGLYEARDALSSCWLHKSNTTGSASWNFATFDRQDEVTITGSQGRISFSVFGEKPLVLTTLTNQEELFIENPENIQIYHVDNIRAALAGERIHPSTGQTAMQTSWVMDKILGRL